MPTYEYKCDGCGHKFEVVKLFKELPPKRCPKCGNKVNQLFSTFSFTIDTS